MGLISFLLHYYIVVQAIWCLKFLNTTKSGEKICISVTHSKFWDVSPRPHVI